MAAIGRIVNNESRFENSIALELSSNNHNVLQLFGGRCLLTLFKKYPSVLACKPYTKTAACFFPAKKRDEWLRLDTPCSLPADEQWKWCLAHAACSCAIKNVAVLRILANCLTNLRIVTINPKRKFTSDSVNFDHLGPASYDSLKARLVAMGLNLELIVNNFSQY